MEGPKINDDFKSFNQSSCRIVEGTKDLIHQAKLFGLDQPNLLKNPF